MQYTEYHVNTLVLGSGAAGLNAALQLRRKGFDDLVILTESLDAGTSINTGSDKQTYYKLSLYGQDDDSPTRMAESLYCGGAMDGDIAMIESALSLRCFYNLLDLGIEFPQDAFGQLPGYKTDHDPRRRATSIGPYTSQSMCRVLIDELRRRNTKFVENRIAIRLLCLPQSDGNSHEKIGGVFCVNLSQPLENCLELYICNNLVFATGGPGGLYRDSVYPKVHIGGIGLALEVGTLAQNLAESQFGLASTAFRWNVSGTYMQVLPRFISTQHDGKSDPREFLHEFLVGRVKNGDGIFDLIFKKGYQWPFDAAKIEGSSLIDLAVYTECVKKRRRVFLDYRTNSDKLDFTMLGDEAREYLEKSGAIFGTPFDRLQKMNPIAVELYRSHGINLETDPLEITVCAQHNNGGLCVGPWWESPNIENLFVAGEVAGAHGIARPGGSALNSGQVAGFRIAEFLSHMRQMDDKTNMVPSEIIQREIACLESFYIDNWQNERNKLQARMSDHGSAFVDLDGLNRAAVEAMEQVEHLYFSLDNRRTGPQNAADWAESIRTRQLCLAHAVYLEAVKQAVKTNGSRGSRICRSANYDENDKRSFIPENMELRNKIQMAYVEISDEKLEIKISERIRRPIPETDAWFETAWADFRNGKIYDTK